MSLIKQDLFGNVQDKVKESISIVRNFEPSEGYYFAYSGGKDSCVSKAILDMAGVKYDTHYNVTTVDPAALVRFIISQFGTVIYQMPDGTEKTFNVIDGRLHKSNEVMGEVIYFSIPQLTMRQLIIDKKVPPTRLMRYCCKELKEVNGEGRVVITGVRAAESANRRKNQGMVTIFPKNKEVAATAEANKANFMLTERGGWY